MTLKLFRPLAVAVAALALSATARAADPAEQQPWQRPGADLGVRVGYAVPMGSTTGAAGDDLSNLFSGAVPLILEAGYRIDAAFSLGLTFQYAFAQVNGMVGCDNQPGVSCSGSVIRLGAEGIYRLPVEGAFVPWLGLGTGYEWISFDVSGNGYQESIGAHGFEFVNFQLGGDIRAAPQFAVGPFVSLSIGQYDTASLSGNAPGYTAMSADIANKATHEWLEFGVRGTLNL
ncbi:MAG TPA: hypothetical protein VHO06_01470 [Polyangia bacterium]|nr:hypothetical protein [Polyangia bacterium]